MDKIVTKKNYDIHIYEVDSHGKATIASIMSYLEDLATYQTEKLGMSLKYFRDNKIAWVVYKWEVHMDKYPEYGDRIEVSTLPYSIRKFYAYRKYEIFNKGERIGYANSLWFLIDTEKRKPCRITNNIYKMYNLTEEDNEQIPFDRLRKLKQVDYKNSFKVRYSDIDTNKHVNNVKYVSWVLENVPMEIISEHEISDLKVMYQKETAYGETIEVMTNMEEKEGKYIFNHSINNSEGESLTLVKTEFRK
ncbi:acyl-ACP thioesterase [Clostridium sp. CT7]|uniref:acyl-ACP thioesterase domain-containing protein n=1 Tax=Clostridium sp. CT7 TaxID=2052574 RepID=UPI00082577D4|nr:MULTISPECIES: acyl-ACP thioesterase domain-containing protein [Clostridium]PJI08494.1 acyl-ACP thioesterase [Clostridium sp. CT7]